MRHTRTTTIAALAILASSFAFQVTAQPVTPFAQAASVELVDSSITGGEFTKKKKKIRGAWNIETRADGNYIVFDESFKTANGPDLKVFLSPQTIANVTGKTAIDGAVLVDVLQSNKGGQEYRIPDGVNLDDFSSVLIHCEAYAILWGGADL